jgi:hypothetical protein
MRSRRCPVCRVCRCSAVVITVLPRGGPGQALLGLWQSEAGGWFLLRQKAEHASQGYSSQDMVVYGRGGRPVLAGRQNVAIYA